MPDIDVASGYTNDTPLGRLASELRARGAELREPNRAAGARQVPVLEPMLEGVGLPVWESVPTGRCSSPGSTYWPARYRR